MTGLSSIFTIFLLCIYFARGREICCNDGNCYDDSPPFDSILLPLPMCPEIMEPIFLLYTRNNVDIPEEFDRLTVPSQFESSKETVLLVHGYNNDHTKGWLERSRKALLKRADFNVVVVGWGKGATTINYFKAVANSRVISTEISYVMDNLYSAAGASPSKMWCVGHSLGAHVCGRVGKITKYKRITGLDPAGPVWDDMPISAGLTKDDADFVDVIHTNGQALAPFGTMLARGHLDFYPNNAERQPGCLTYEKGAVKGMDLVRTRRGFRRTFYNGADSRSAVNCSHSRSKEYFIESVAEPCLRATSTCTDIRDIPDSCSPCSGAGCPFMGYDATPSDTHGGLYNLQTAAAEPWCLK